MYLIEPHPDDVFMSLHAHITTLWKDIPKTIVTVTGSGDRIKEAEDYARSVGCLYMSLGYEDSNWGSSNIPRELSIGHDDPEHQFIFPLGLRHPDHKRVAELAPKSALFYLDAYYVQCETNGELPQALHGRAIQSALWASESKRYYLSRFTSQAVRFMLAQPNYPPRFELVVK